MTRSSERRPATALRLGEDVLERIDNRAIAEGLLKGNGDPNRSELIRLFIDFGEQFMPPDWRPDPESSQAVGAYILAEGSSSGRRIKTPQADPLEAALEAARALA